MVTPPTDEANEANKADKAEAFNEAVVANKAKAKEAIVAKDAIGFVKLPVLHPFSLTKCTAIFTEVKGYFGILNNQL